MHGGLEYPPTPTGWLHHRHRLHLLRPTSSAYLSTPRILHLQGGVTLKMLPVLNYPVALSLSLSPCPSVLVSLAFSPPRCISPTLRSSLRSSLNSLSFFFYFLARRHYHFSKATTTISEIRTTMTTPSSSFRRTRRSAEGRIVRECERRRSRKCGRKTRAGAVKSKDSVRECK